jgi:hypothetical protein
MYTGLPSRFYHNNGDGIFSDHTQIAGFLPAPGKSLGVVQLDYNDDGWPDLAVANDGERDLLYQNNGDGTFTEKGTELGMAYGENGEARAGMGIDAGIVDSSGYPSIFVGNFSNEMIGVYRYSGKGWFNDRAALSRIGRTSYLSLTFGLFLFDVDLDTDLDLFVGNGHVYPFRTRRGQDLLGWDHHPKVDDLEVVAAQNDTHNVLADVVHVTLDSRHHDDALALRCNSLKYFSARGNVQQLPNKGAFAVVVGFVDNKRVCNFKNAGLVHLNRVTHSRN